jgi:hypothetical protein
MLSTKPKKSGMRVKIKHHQDDSLKHEVREMFIGHHTIFSLIGLAIGGTLVGKVLWEWLSVAVGLPLTFIIGLLVFIVSGLAVHSFGDDRYGSELDEELIEEVVEG